MADLTRTVSIIFSGEDRVTVATDKISRTFQEVGTQAGGAAGKVDQLDQELEGLEQKAPGIASVSTALQALAASLVVKDFIDANVAQEQFLRTLELVTGSAEGARREFEFVREASNRLGVETRSTADAYAKFAAATKGTALEGEGARVVFEGFAGSLSRVGASSADISGAFVQLAQGVSKGKFELEDLKSIAERFPGFFTQFADSLGKTSAELFDLISAGEIGGPELLKFAESLNAGLAGVEFDGFNNNLARLKNAINDTYLVIGDAGAFDVLIKGLQVGTAAVVGSVQAFTLLGEIIGAFFAKLSLGSSFDFGAAVSASVDEAANATRAASDALLGAEKSTKAVGDAAAVAGDKLVEGLGQGALSADALKKATAEIEKSLKALGVDPKTFSDPVKELGEAFKTLATNAAASGEQIVTGLIGALQKLPQDANLDEFRRQIAFAFRDGKVTADEYAQALALIDTKQKGLSPSFGPVTDAARKQADELRKTSEATKKAAEETDKYRLELEKIASNERIKNIEAKISLNIAQLEADTERVKSAFTSIDNTVNSTGDLLGDLFGLFKDFDNLSFGAIRQIERQIDEENRRRDDALKLQKDLTQAQIAEIRARTQSLERGDSLIKIDGAGLQPHLEAFMFEILRAIQVRVNADGLRLLLGT